MTLAGTAAMRGQGNDTLSELLQESRPRHHERRFRPSESF